MEILHRNDLPEGGFAGLREYRLVMDSKAFGDQRDPGTREGVGNFVYLADARFLPGGETRQHRHREIDVISVRVEGRCGCSPGVRGIPPVTGSTGRNTGSLPAFMGDRSTRARPLTPCPD